MIFSDQVESLTGITISASGTNPTNDQLTQYLKDGVIDVTAKWLIGHPQDIEDFQIASSEYTANDSYSPKGTIVSVVRESGTNNDWRPGRKLSPVQLSVVLDTESLSFSSKYHPTYMAEDNGKISVFPVAAVGGADSFKVYYINNDPKNNTDNAELVHSMSDIRFFPTDKVYLVVLYAAMQSLQVAMSNSVISLSISSPATPVLTAVTFSSIDTTFDASAPVFTTTSISAASTYTGSAPSYTNQVVAPDFSQVNTYIDTNQDTELASAKLQEIGAQVQEMSVKMQDSLNIFNKENVAYQSAIQESMQEMQASNQINLAKAQADLQLALANKDRDLQRQLQNGINDMQAIVTNNQSAITKYQAEVADYQAEVGKEIQESTTKTQQYQGLYVQLLQQYNAAFQVAQPQQQGGR